MDALSALSRKGAVTTSRALRKSAKARAKATAPPSATYAFGATQAQIDRFHQLLRTISAHSDMVAVCAGAQMDDASLSTLGESIFAAAHEVRVLVDTIYAQRLRGGEPLAEG
ncbi:hypothetical protein [Pseudoxanthomonas winnipegensis]|uniref:hypothetical protein n=1 Tax=Pseudoxanthomonas winnipegensis TaxID=2480810 RepID=UPI001D18AD03|nr:hypothetical protein [Pseudoxanthomonas winnipegensis]